MTPVVAIDPDPEIRRVLDMPGGSPYAVQSLASFSGSGAVVVSRAATAAILAARSADIKVIAVGRPDELLGCLRAGAYCFFSEPVNDAIFREVVQSALGAAGWRDDIEVVTGTADWLSLRVRCKIQTVDRLTQWLRELEYDLHPKDRDDLVIAFRELLANAIEHGGGHDPELTLQISRIRMQRARAYHIKDPGPGFSLADLPHAAISNEEDDPLRHVDVRNQRGIRPGGFGILLSRKLSDEVLYNETGNEVLLVKYVSGLSGQ
jgi:anti-sigma regulatory factor (Ser/Thr protein kinase)